MASAQRRIAVVQAPAVAFDAVAGLAALRDYARQAADDGCDIVVFPEAYLGGYPRGIAFGTAVGIRTPEGRDWYWRYHAGAVDIPGPVTADLAAISAELKVFMVVGVIERAGGTLYCTVVFIDSHDGIISTRRKLMPTGTERLVWGQGDLAQSPVVGVKYSRTPLNASSLLEKQTSISSTALLVSERFCMAGTAKNTSLRRSSPLDHARRLEFRASDLRCSGGLHFLSPGASVICSPDISAGLSCDCAKHPSSLPGVN